MTSKPFSTKWRYVKAPVQPVGKGLSVSKYDAAHIERFYDEYADREWDRLGPEASAIERVNFHIHRTYLERYLRPGWQVLEAGAGAGRFTVELARLGLQVTVGDLSARQLELNRQHSQEQGVEVVAFEKLDIDDLSRFGDASFDAVVCYGGPLSYVFDRAGQALDELVRVTRPGGRVLLSVMSLVGSTQKLLPRIFKALSPERMAQVITTGDLDQLDGHRLRMYRWSTLSRLLDRSDCRLLAASASGHLCIGNEEAAGQALDDPQLRDRFLEWELDLCAEPGALDGGTHILAVVEKLPVGELGVAKPDTLT